jgi:hypothetical protein
MENETGNKKTITTEDAVRILSDNGMSVSKEKANEILKLLRVLAKIEVEQYLKR